MEPAVECFAENKLAILREEDVTAITKETFLHLGEMIVTITSSARAVTPKSGTLKRDMSYVTGLDLLTQELVRHEIERQMPTLIYASEESEETHYAIRLRGVHGSFDPIDGTKYFRKGKPPWASSFAVMSEGRPLAGVVIQPVLCRAFAAYREEGVFEWDFKKRQWKPFAKQKRTPTVIGSDLDEDHSPALYKAQVKKIEEALCVSCEAMPAVHAGIMAFLGEIQFCWSHTYHHWDLAAIALLLEMTGGVAECVDRRQIPWNQIKMPPILLAASREYAEIARSQLL